MTRPSKIKVSELFYSIQGEGKYMGVPSVFLRVFGCNFSCGGFGMPKGQLSGERDEIAKNIEIYKDYGDLPLVSTGCDSYASWDPRFKHLSPFMTVDEIVEKTLDLLPHKKWADEHLIITGGEPLLGWQRAYPALLGHEKMADLQEITFETNGTQPLSNDLIEYLEEWKASRDTDGLGGWSRLTFSVSAKLSVSGEDREVAIQPELIAEYEKVGCTYLKFVVATEEDVIEAEEAVRDYRDAGFAGPIYLMPVGGVESVYHMNNRTVAELAMKRGWRYSDRLQVPLFKNQWAT